MEEVGQAAPVMKAVPTGVPAVKAVVREDYYWQAAQSLEVPVEEVVPPMEAVVQAVLVLKALQDVGTV